jgi:hypothetical protein
MNLGSTAVPAACPIERSTPVNKGMDDHDHQQVNVPENQAR